VARLNVARPWWNPLPANPVRPVFRMLTSVRFAIGNIVAVAVAAMLGVVLPQMPGFVRSDPQLRTAWLQDHHSDFGPLTTVMDRLELFEVFHSSWFYLVAGLLLVSVAVCSGARFLPTWRSVRRPQTRAGDQYFRSARHRLAVPAPTDMARVEAELRRRRYAVREVDGSASLYADRYAWARLATFASHLALLILGTGGLLTWSRAFSEDILIAEHQARPVLAPGSPGQLLVKVEGFVRTQDAEGHDTDIHSDLAIYRDGQEVARGRSTINDPLKFDGYVFHQAAFAQSGAAIELRDPATGRVVYSDTLNLFGSLPVPNVTVTDASGRTAFSGPVPPTFFPGANSGAATIALADGSHLAIAIRKLADPPPGAPPWSLVVGAPGGESGDAAMHHDVTVGGFDVRFDTLAEGHYLLVDGLPGTNGRQALVETAPDQGGQQLLVIDPDGTIARATTAVAGSFHGYEVRFLGPRQFSGITVQRDPGSRFIWVGVVLLLGGLIVTFAFPRRRIWLRIADGRLELAGVTEREPGFDAELAAIAASGTRPKPAEVSDDDEEAT